MTSTAVFPPPGTTHPPTRPLLQDREAHLHDYPALSHPHVFVLQVGAGGSAWEGRLGPARGGGTRARWRGVSYEAAWRQRRPIHPLRSPLPPIPRSPPGQGGYKAFWRCFSELCEGGYVPMDHPDYSTQLKVGLGWVC